jgi:predicted secreted protein
MNVFTGILVYVLIWWVVLFMVLPWKADPPEEPETGHAPSAPEKPMLWRKALVTTVIAAVLWLGAYYLIDSQWLQFRGAIRNG